MCFGPIILGEMALFDWCWAVGAFHPFWILTLIKYVICRYFLQFFKVPFRSADYVL